MYRKQFVLLLLLLLLLFGIIKGYSQEISYRQPLTGDSIRLSKDTIKLYLDDSAYYIQKDIRQLMNDLSNKTDYFEFFSSTDALEFALVNNLPNGFYCLYNITKKQIQKKKNYEKYIVASGEFKDGMKQGEFIFHYLEFQLAEAFKIVNFKNDTVHGQVIEVLNGKIKRFGEYNMGIKDGFFYDTESIILYKDGEIVKETEIFY